MANTFYWHDYETFGVDPSKDRPSQFAGLRTDEDLNPVGEPLVIYCQPQKDILPAPQACLITGITPQLAMEKGCWSLSLSRQSTGSSQCQAPVEWVTTVFALMTRSLVMLSIETFLIPINESGKTAILAGILWICCA